MLLSTLDFFRRRKETISTEEMKGLCLSIQLNAYCGVGEEGRLLT
jgi:hypothetical protein